MHGFSAGQKYIFTIQEGADGTDGRISVNYDGFIDDCAEGDQLLVDGGILALKILSKDVRDVLCEVIDGGVMKSRSVTERSLITSNFLSLSVGPQCSSPLDESQEPSFDVVRWEVNISVHP